jgi:hypothetical protein
MTLKLDFPARYRCSAVCTGRDDDAPAAREAEALPDPSPLKTSTTTSVTPIDAKTPVMPGVGADAAASPTVIHPVGHKQAQDDSTWGSNWEGSNQDASAGMESMDLGTRYQVSSHVHACARVSYS